MSPLSFPQERRGAQNMITSQNLMHCNDHIKGYMSTKLVAPCYSPLGETLLVYELSITIFINISNCVLFIDDLLWNFSIYIIYISCTLCRKSLPALILRVLASFVISKTIHKLLVLSEKTPTVYLLDSNSKDGDHWWTYLFNG